MLDKSVSIIRRAHLQTKWQPDAPKSQSFKVQVRQGPRGDVRGMAQDKEEEEGGREREGEEEEEKEEDLMPV